MVPIFRTNAGALVYRFNGRKLELLLVHQSDKRKNLWSIPKGGVDAYEDLESAARREVLEETGVQLDNLEFLGYVDYGKANKRLYCYMGLAPDGQRVQAHLPEIDKAQFFEIGQAKRMVEKQQRAMIHALQKIMAFGAGKKNSA
jgi:predicted NUDIX family NTP pyrophosphohydrolase